MSDFIEGEEEYAAKAFGCEEEDLILINGLIAQKLDGLCGYELESDTLVDAIKEVLEGDFQFSEIGQAVIFEGVESNETNSIPDGDLFNPISIAKII